MDGVESDLRNMGIENGEKGLRTEKKGHML
jgi:hypothetical protein